jgi:hypothetical protein
MAHRSRPLMFRFRRRFTLAVAVSVLAASVVIAHSALASDHMGSAVAICIAVAETAALALLARTTTQVGGAAIGIYTPRPSDGRTRPAPTRAPALPWSRGSPFALQVLRM